MIEPCGAEEQRQGYDADEGAEGRRVIPLREGTLV